MTMSNGTSTVPRTPIPGTAAATRRDHADRQISDGNEHFDECPRTALLEWGATMGVVRELPRPFRAYADGRVDGGDLWPADLTDADLAAIAAIDKRIQSQEGDGLSRTAEIFDGRPVFSVAERIRHWCQLVEILEPVSAITAGEYATELGCRSLVERYLAELPVGLRAKVMSEVVAPLDARFKSLTIDDGGNELASHVRIDGDPSTEWWWRRRPAALPHGWSL